MLRVHAAPLVAGAIKHSPVQLFSKQHMEANNVMVRLKVASDTPKSLGSADATQPSSAKCGKWQLKLECPRNRNRMLPSRSRLFPSLPPSFLPICRIDSIYGFPRSLDSPLRCPFRSPPLPVCLSLPSSSATTRPFPHRLQSKYGRITPFPPLSLWGLPYMTTSTKIS